MKLFVAEFVGTLLLVLLGDGVVAACLLRRSKAEMRRARRILRRPSPLSVAYCCLPDFRPCRHPDVRVTRLDRFTCVTAWTSLCLRLTHVVAFMSPRLDSRWGGSSPFRGGNLTR